MAFHYNPKEFIKVYRKLLEWEWYTDVKTKTLFIHCLLRANWKAGEWHGIHYDEGEFITSLPSISRETGLSIRQARGALSRLEMTGELTSRLTDNVTGKKLTKNRIITVKNWNSYQGSDRQNDRQNDSQPVNQTTGKRQATRQSNDSRYKNIKNIRTKEEEKENKEKENLLPFGPDIIPGDEKGLTKEQRETLNDPDGLYQDEMSLKIWSNITIFNDPLKEIAVERYKKVKGIT